MTIVCLHKSGAAVTCIFQPVGGANYIFLQHIQQERGNKCVVALAENRLFFVLNSLNAIYF